MYFKFQRRFNLLVVDESFARLNSIQENGDLEFEFVYTISQREALQRRALSVDVSVFSKTVERKHIIENISSKVDTKSLIRNVLTQLTDAKNASSQRKELRVAGRTSDITSKINNEVISQLKSTAALSSIPSLTRSVLKPMSVSDLRKNNDIKPLLGYTAHVTSNLTNTVVSASVDANVRRLMHDAIMRQGVDPSTIVALDDRSISPQEAVSGVRKTSTQEQLFSPSSQLLNYHINKDVQVNSVKTSLALNDSEVTQVLVQETQENINVPILIVVPRPKLRIGPGDNSHFFVKFELKNSVTGIVIDSVVKQLDVTKHLQLFNTPKIAPTVNAARAEISTRVNLEIKQNDPGAVGVLVFKKVMFVSSTDVDEYSQIGSYSVKNTDQTLLIQVDMPRNSTVIYRIIPVGVDGTQGSEFTNVVVNPSRFSQLKSISLVTLNVDNGIKVELSKIPPNVVAVQVLSRNMTIFQEDYDTVTQDVLVIDDSIRVADHLTLVDTNVRSGNVYEYTCKLIFRSGVTELSGNSTVEFFLPEPGKVDTKISNIVVQHAENPNVTFSISTTIVDNNIDIIKNLLQRQDIFEQFKDDVMKEREFLKSLIAHNVQRVDLTLGSRDDFGVIIDGSFSDKDLRKNQSIPPLRLGHKYRYEVSTLLRTPESMFESLSKERTDLTTKKQYTFSPAKFMHPIALTRGMLVTTAGLRTKFSKQAMSHGTIGSVEVVEASFDSDSARLQDASVTRFNKRLNLVTWRLLGEMSSVDHFLVMKEMNSIRTVVGKAHSEFKYGNCQYLHSLGNNDEGHYTYVIVPVLNDYTVGKIATTNSVTVESFK